MAKKRKPAFPRPSEIPPVEQEQLRSLYRQYVSGIRDIELLEEVESRLLARAEIWLELHYGLRDCMYAIEEGKGPKEEDSEGCFEKWGEIADRYGMYEIEGNIEEVAIGFDALQMARRKSFDARMLAIDKLVHALHDRGPFAGNFIEGGLGVEDFLDELEAWRPVGTTPWRETDHGSFRYRRPNVRAYRRRA